MHEVRLDPDPGIVREGAAISSTVEMQPPRYTIFCQISGFHRDELLGAPHRIVNSGHHSRSFFKALWKSIGHGNVWRGDICNRAKCGRFYWVDTTIAPLRDPTGQRTGYVSIRFDISDRKEAETRLMEALRLRQSAEELLSDIVDAIPNGLIAFDPEGRLLFSNNAFHQLCAGATAASDDMGRSPLARGMRGRKPLSDELQAIAAPNGDTRSLTKPYVRQLGERKWIQVHNRRSASGNLVSVQADISELKGAEQMIKDQAEKDALTGLANRAAMLRRLNRLQCDDRAPLAQSALIMLDLDDFKSINDRFGHDSGDTFLGIIAERLHGAVRRTDLVARLGGDEFAILLHNLHNRKDIYKIAQDILNVLRSPAKLGHQTIIPSASLGVSIFPRDGKTPKELYKNADLALYQAKLAGRNRFTVYNSALRRERRRRLNLIEKLRGAVKRNELAVALQPQADIRTGQHVGFEALVRWQLGASQIPPLELISVAEEAGLICEMSFQVIDKALCIMAALKRANLSPGMIAFNVVSAQLLEPDFAERLLRLVALHGLSAREIEVEVTENVILDRSAGDIAAVLHGLHAVGISIALDDFGTGYASLTHLKQFPINRLKIDRTFIEGILDEKDDEIIVRTIISLAHSLSLEVVAEGVQSTAQYRQLSNLGCDFIQGFLLARPMNESDARVYLDAVRQSWPRYVFHDRRIGQLTSKNEEQYWQRRLIFTEPKDVSTGHSG